jgi:CheY-like chemotaxis protein/HPt (histidine-containing phosphotransfer) domain-containing protein
MNESSLRNKRILVVEDNTINQMLVKHTLSKTGAVLDLAEDGVMAVDLASQNTYDVILMDLQLPEMDGYEASRKMRTELKLNTPIIAMSAMMFLGEEKKCDDAGMNGYMLKPFSLEVFTETLEKIKTKQTTPETKVDDNIIKADGLTLDTSVLYNLGGTDASYLKLVVQTFLDSMSAVMIKLDAAFKAKDFEALGKTAHFAKSSLSVVKIDELFDMMKQLELQCKTKTELETVAEKLEWLNVMYPKAEKILRRIFEIPEASEAKVAP